MRKAQALFERRGRKYGPTHPVLSVSKVPY
jgi:hypothetical protein